MINYEYNRIIPTGVKATDITKDIFESVIGQMSDGIWENTNGMESYWNDAEIETENGEIVIKVIDNRFIQYRKYNRRNDWSYAYRVNKYANMTDNEILRFYKNKIRCIAKHEDKDNLELSSMTEEEKTTKYYFSESYKIPARLDYTWKADNTTSLNYLDYKSGVTVGDAYKVVKALAKKL